MRTALAIALFILAALMFATGSAPTIVRAVLDFVGVA